MIITNIKNVTVEKHDMKKKIIQARKKSNFFSMAYLSDDEKG